jgi:hypothetical protein
MDKDNNSCMNVKGIVLGVEGRFGNLKNIGIILCPFSPFYQPTIIPAFGKKYLHYSHKLCKFQ